VVHAASDRYMGAARQVQVHVHMHVHVSAGELLQLIGECPCTAIDRFRSGSPIIVTARGCRAPRRDVSRSASCTIRGSRLPS
jgi:hypothetical protein